MNIKHLIFFFMLIILVVAQVENQDDQTPGDQQQNPPPDDNQPEPPKSTDNTGGNPAKTTDNTATTPVNPNPPKDTKQTTTPGLGANTTPIAAQTTAKVVAQTTKANKVKATAAATVATVTYNPALPTASGDNGTPVPTVNVSGNTATHNSEESFNWSKALIIGGCVIGGLLAVGVVFNFINKAKESNSDPINFVVDNQPPEPEMSTSMFNQNDVYGGQQQAGYNDYDMQYGQYGADQYPQPAVDPYSQGYAQEVNYAQRTMSLNRNPAANNQAYQNDQNAREVIYNHRPEADDEIELRRGDQATIYEKYEDGWAWGYNITTGKTGMFPQQCLA